MPKVNHLTVEFGDTNTITRTNELSKSDKNRIARSVPTQVEIENPLTGGKWTLQLRSNLRAFLDNLPSPSFEIDFAVEGSCESLEDTAIEAVSEMMTGTNTGSLEVAGVGFVFEIDARVVGRKARIKTCKCKDGRSGKMISREFKIRWYLQISMNPGLGGTYPTDIETIYVNSECCCKKKEELKKESPKRISEKEKQSPEEMEGSKKAPPKKVKTASKTSKTRG